MHGKICATSRLHSRCATLTCTSAARHRNLNTALTSVSISRKSHVDRTLVLRRAATEKDGVKEDAKPSVPPAPPSDKGPSVAQESSAAENASSSNEPVDGKRLSAEEIAAQLSQLRAAAKEQSSKEGLVEGVLEEVQLITWPTPQSALVNTLLVIGIVAGTSAVLFGVNTLLAELSREIYSAL